MRRPDDEVLEALADLQNSYAWRKVQTWIEQSNADLVESCRREHGEVQLRMSQGGTQQLGELIDAATSAKELIRSRRKSREQ